MKGDILAENSQDSGFGLLQSNGLIKPVICFKDIECRCGTFLKIPIELDLDFGIFL